MAIRRCPYCKAIIDEGSEYCSNCGTQLIFPEDEFVEEEIPGEKVVDVNEDIAEPQEKQNSTKGRGQATKGKGGRKKAAEVTKKEDAEVVKAEVEADESEVAEPEPEVEVKPPSEELLEPKEEISLKKEEEAEEEAEEDAAQDESADFRTADLEGMVDPAEKEKEEIEKFLDSLKEERERTKKYYEETGELPPWAQSMREGTALEAPFEEEEEFGVEPIEPEEGEEAEKLEEPAETEEPAEPDKEIPTEDGTTKEEEPILAADTGMGLPEGVDQQNLPFGQGLFESTTAKGKKRHFKKPDVQFSPWIKSRIFDVLIIVGMWLVALWLASRVIGIGFFQLLTTSTVQTIVFLVILLIVYFFLFLFFLGETLGDHLFSEEL